MIDDDELHNNTDLRVMSDISGIQMNILLRHTSNQNTTMTSQASKSEQVSADFSRLNQSQQVTAVPEDEPRLSQVLSIDEENQLANQIYLNTLKLKTLMQMQSQNASTVGIKVTNQTVNIFNGQQNGESAEKEYLKGLRKVLVQMQHKLRDETRGKVVIAKHLVKLQRLNAVKDEIISKSFLK